MTNIKELEGHTIDKIAIGSRFIVDHQGKYHCECIVCGKKFTRLSKSIAKVLKKKREYKEGKLSIEPLLRCPHCPQNNASRQYLGTSSGLHHMKQLKEHMLNKVTQINSELYKCHENLKTINKFLRHLDKIIKPTESECD